MSVLNLIIEKAKLNRRNIVLPEGDDRRIVEAAYQAAHDGLAKITLLGDPRKIAKLAPPQSDVAIIDTRNTSLHGTLSEAFYELRKDIGGTKEFADTAMRDPIKFAAMMVRLGLADGTVGGATTPTAEIIRNAVKIIGLASNTKIASSFFLMILDKAHHPKQGAFVFADCALTIEPDAIELADIAIKSATSFQNLTGMDAKIAMLSFSTLGSAKHKRVSKVIEATRIVKWAHPELIIDGELQFDAAFVENVALSKAPHSMLKGAANIFVFPNLESGNIGYKIAERIGGAKAIGPILQGLAKPANDLSRGCTADDAYNMIAVTAAQAASA
jgi:phosphate acetyltransferase